MRLALLLILLAAGSASAAEIRVDAEGGGAYPTIGAAVDAAASGDVLLIAPGTYTEDLVLGDGRILTLQGDDPGSTIIAGTGERSTVSIGSGGNAVTLRGLTITGGVTGGDGGCLNISDSNPIIEDVIAYGCEAARGGCVGFNNSNAQLTNVVLHSCRAVTSGVPDLSVGLGGAVYGDDSSPTMIGLQVWGNTADESGGAMLFYNGGAPTIEDSWIHDNTSPFAGGITVWSNSELTLLRVMITDNVHCEGGGLMGFQGGSISASGSLIARNIVDRTGLCDPEDGDGAGVTVRSAELAMRASVIAFNDAGDGVGGGVFVREAGSVASFERTIIRDNTAALSAGLLANQDASEVRLDRCRISGNVAGISGGGARIEVPDGVVEGVLFDGNRSSNFAGDLSVEATAADPGISIHHSLFFGGQSTQGGSLVVQGIGVHVTSNTFYGADTGSSGSGTVHLIEAAGRGVQGSFSSNVVATSDGAWDLFAEPMAGSLEFPISWSVLAGGTSGSLGGELATSSPVESLEQEPTFTSADVDSDWDRFLRFAAGSPGIDDGDPELGNDPDGSAPDRGAFGGAGASIWANGDVDGDGITVWEGDCNDDDPRIHPGADEVTNCLDDNCDLIVDPESTAATFCYAPRDDGAGDDDDSADWSPAAGCLVRCDATAAGGSPATLLLLLSLEGWRRRRYGARR